MEETTRRGGRSGPEAEAHAARMRKLAELHLYAAHGLDSRSPGTTCFAEGSGQGCLIVVEAGK